MLAFAALLALAAAIPASARAAIGETGGSLQQRVESEPETTTTSTTSTTASTSTSEPSNDHTTILLAAAGAVLLLSAIGFVIVRDARRVAPATEAEIAEGRTGRDTAVLMRKRRAKAKAARKQRKRTRSR
jgi:hypothetical protein